MLFEQNLGQTNVTSPVERVSQFTVILKNPNKRTKPVMSKIIKTIKDLPLIARRSITFDRGTEFVNWPHLQAKLGTQTWFCNPISPWQKGTVENTNRRTRRWLPRKRDIKEMTDHDIKLICDGNSPIFNGVDADLSVKPPPALREVLGDNALAPNLVDHLGLRFLAFIR